MQNILNQNAYVVDCLHNIGIIIVTRIVIIVGVLLRGLVFLSWINKFYVEDRVLEFFWTCFPIFILCVFGYFSMISLYNHEVETTSDLTIKIVGHQWYWSYDYCDFSGISFDSYMLPLREFFLGAFRNLDVDNRVIIPFNTIVRFLVTSRDVLHSWAIPAFGVKVDANPGKLNWFQTFTTLPGLFFGQCSEICGVNHSFIPICVEATSPLLFMKWVLTY